VLWQIIKESAWLILALILLLGMVDAMGDVTSSGSTTNTQSNNAGSNTAITGGYESSTTYQSGSSSNTTTNNETNNSTNQKTAVNSSSAPAMSVYGQGSCVIPLSLGMTTIGFSFSAGNYYIDEECERRKKAELLKKLGMSVAAIALMTQDEDVWNAMMAAGTPPPIDGLIGEAAKKRWEEVGGFHRIKEKKYSTKPSMTWNHMLDK
jgi:hypothetical protein